MDVYHHNVHVVEVGAWEVDTRERERERERDRERVGISCESQIMGPLKYTTND